MTEETYTAPTVEPSSPSLLLERKLEDRLRELLSLDEPVHAVRILGDWGRAWRRGEMPLQARLVPDGARTVAVLICGDALDEDEWAYADHEDAVHVAFVEEPDGLGSVPVANMPRLLAAGLALHSLRCAIEDEDGGDVGILDVLMEYVPFGTCAVLGGSGAPLEYASAAMEVLDYEGMWVDLQPFPLGRLFLRGAGFPLPQSYLDVLAKAGDL